MLQKNMQNKLAGNNFNDEKILVVKQDMLFSEGSWSGLHLENIDHVQKIIECYGQFEWRSTMEQDSSFKQIIPYLIFNYSNNFFLMQRRANASEERLKNKFSLGIGGHIRQEDMTGASIFDWASREFNEEVSYQGTFSIEPLGTINDDSNSVGQVHLGLVLLLKGTSPEISIKSEHKQGILIPLLQLNDFYDTMEPWSQIVLNYLLINNTHK